MSLTFDANSTSFPLRKDLPRIDGAPDGAAWFWGKDDMLGRLNLLTPQRVLEAAKEIRTGQRINLDLPLNDPDPPASARQSFKHTIKALMPDLAYDDVYELNTQSGTQWDGFRHAAHFGSACFYNGVKGSDIDGPEPNLKNSIHYWAEHGITGRGVLLDYQSWALSQGIKYESWSQHEILFKNLEACGKAQGIDIRPASQGGSIHIGDIVLIRSGYTSDYKKLDSQKRIEIATRSYIPGPNNPTTWIGVSQEKVMIDWLHNCYFAAVAGDSPTFEVWPSKSPDGMHIHEHALALWGMPLGEMFDLDALSEACKSRERWTFFFTSSPANCKGGVASHGNAYAIL